MFNKRMIVALITGSILGIFCVVGANSRYNGDLSNLYIFSFWFNRFLMGFVLGLITYKTSLIMKLVRGFVVGLLVSFAFYSATDFLDLTGFIAGGVYGIIIEFVAYKFESKHQL